MPSLLECFLNELIRFANEYTTMNYLKKFLILLILPLLSFTTAHKYYVSVTQIDYIKDKQALQITSRIFVDDFERLLQERYDESIVLATGDQETQIDLYIEKYLRSKLLISINGTPSKFVFLGKSYEDDIVTCYLEIENIAEISSFEIKNLLLFDIFEEQKNIVRTYINSRYKTFTLSLENDKGMLNF